MNTMVLLHIIVYTNGTVIGWLPIVNQKKIIKDTIKLNFIFLDIFV